MAKKPVKKSKPTKPSKTGKPAKPVKKLDMASVLKKAAKQVAKKVGASIAKNAGKPKKAAKEAKRTLPPAAAKKKPALSLAKGKKVQAPVIASKGKKSVPVVPAIKGKGKKEVILEVPAPKGVALLSKEGKKKGKAGAAEAQLAAAKKRCREPGCDHEFTLSGYCRLHYIKNWRKIKRKEAIIASGQLNNYVEELVSKYPDKYLEVIRQDLASEKDWAKVVVDLELESSEEDPGSEDEMDAVPEGVRAGRGEYEDEGESF